MQGELPSGDLWHANPSYLRRRAAFLRFHQDYPEVYAELAQRARVMLQHDERFGIRTLWESMRWDFMLRSGPNPQPYKLNDHHTSFYARLLMATEPDLTGIFSTRGPCDG